MEELWKFHQQSSAFYYFKSLLFNVGETTFIVTLSESLFFTSLNAFFVSLRIVRNQYVLVFLPMLMTHRRWCSCCGGCYNALEVLPLSLSSSIFINLCIDLYVSQSVSQSISEPVCLSVFLYVYLSNVCVYLSIFAYPLTSTQAQS